MKNSNKLTSTLIALLLIASTAKADDGGYDWLKQRLDNTKAFTIEVLEAMPEGDYSFKPNEDQRTFKAQAYHIVYTVDYFYRAISNGGQAQWAPDDENSKSKAELIAWADEQFDRIHKYILEQEANGQLTAGVVSYLDHNAHHRGQIVTYLRFKGITPPQYK